MWVVCCWTDTGKTIKEDKEIKLRKRYLKNSSIMF